MNCLTFKLRVRQSSRMSNVCYNQCYGSYKSKGLIWNYHLAVAGQNTIIPCIFVKFYSRWCPPRLIGSDVCPRSKIRFHVTTGKTKVYEIINYGWLVKNNYERIHSNYVLRWALFIKTESGIWAGLGQFCSLDLPIFL